MKRFSVLLFIVVFLGLFFAGCNKIGSSRGPSFSDQEIIAITEIFCKNAISDKEYFNWYKIPNPKIVIIEKGNLTEKKEIPVKVSISGKAYGSVGDRDVLKNPNFLQFAFKDEFKNEIRVFYISKNEFGKIRLYDNMHASYVEYQ